MRQIHSAIFRDNPVASALVGRHHCKLAELARRVEIARALMGRPKVLFLDEPTRGLDLPAKRDMWNLLRRLAMEEQVTTFLSSHDAQEVRSLCSEISVIASGRVVYTGSTRELGADLDTFEERLVELLTQQDCLA